MALLLINEETPAKEIVKNVLLETGLTLKITYKEGNFSNSPLTIYQIWKKIKSPYFLLKTQRRFISDDFIIVNRFDKILTIQEDLNLLFGLNFSFTKENELIDLDTRFNDLVTLNNDICELKLHLVNLKLQELCTEAFKEMKLYKYFYYNNTHKNEQITDFEIKLDIHLQLNQMDLLFSNDSDNFILTLHPFFLAENLEEFQDDYINRDYSHFLKINEIKNFKMTNRLFYELIEKMELSDICRIGNIWCDINYISQKFISIH